MYKAKQMTPEVYLDDSGVVRYDNGLIVTDQYPVDYASAPADAPKLIGWTFLFFMVCLIYGAWRLTKEDNNGHV